MIISSMSKSDDKLANDGIICTAMLRADAAYLTHINKLM